jgi:hypothetical protein
MHVRDRTHSREGDESAMKPMQKLRMIPQLYKFVGDQREDSWPMRDLLSTL